MKYRSVDACVGTLENPNPHKLSIKDFEEQIRYRRRFIDAGTETDSRRRRYAREIRQLNYALLGLRTYGVINIPVA